MAIKGLIEVAHTDIIMSEIYRVYVTKKDVPEKSEVKEIIHFLATFAIGCRRQKMEELGDTYCSRVNCYVWIMQKIGYKHGRAYVGRKSHGLYEELGLMLYGIPIG